MPLLDACTLISQHVIPLLLILSLGVPVSRTILTTVLFVIRSYCSSLSAVIYGRNFVPGPTVGPEVTEMKTSYSCCQ